MATIRKQIMLTVEYDEEADTAPITEVDTALFLQSLATSFMPFCIKEAKAVEPRPSNIREVNVQDGEDVARLVSSFLNSYGSSTYEKQFAKRVLRDHRTVQQKFMGLFMRCVEVWAQDFREEHFDARNEATVKLANAIMTKTTEQERILPFI